MLHEYRLVDELQAKKVLRLSEPSGSPPVQKRALNFVTGWDAKAASYIILSPTIFSILVSILWPVVAVGRFDADVQSSIQTGTAVASYIVTAGGQTSSLEHHTWRERLAC